MILSCFCDSTVTGKTRGAEFQDREHGHHRRVHNALKRSPPLPRHYKCTICGRERAK